jgi:hypothetical protein
MQFRMIGRPGLTATVDGNVSHGVRQAARRGAEAHASSPPGRVSVDRHRDLDRAVADDLTDDVRRHAQVEQERNTGVPKIMKTNGSR